MKAGDHMDIDPLTSIRKTIFNLEFPAVLCAEYIRANIIRTR